MTAAAALAGALGAALVLPARSRWALVAGLALLALASAGLAVAFAAELGGGSASLTISPAVIGGALAGAALLAGIAVVLVRFPAAIVPLLVLVAPFRPPLDPDPEAPLLLTLRPDALVGYYLPLYAVLAAGALALVWRVVRGERLRPLPRRVAYPAAALVALVAVSLLWSRDREAGINEVLLFWLPLTALVAIVAHAPLPAWIPRALAWIVVGLGALFALVGLTQVAVGQVLFSTPALANANATTDLFRVTSLFQDPSIYGRHLVIAMAVVLVALWLARLRLPVGVAILALLATALYFTYSQSSLLSLAAGAIAVAAASGGPRVRRLAVVLIAVATLAGIAALAVAAAGGAAADVTRGRSTLVLDTAALIAERPLVGVGVGGQPVAAREEAGGERSVGQSTSHTTPLTIAAETGVLGLAAYLALLAGTALVLRELHRREPALALGLGAVLLVLFVHALIYEGFFETALSWGAIGLAGAALARGRQEEASEAATPPARRRAEAPAT